MKFLITSGGISKKYLIQRLDELLMSEDYLGLIMLISKQCIQFT